MTPDNFRDAKIHPESSPELDRLVMQLIGRIADKWTMLVIEILTEKGELRFGQLSRACDGISQKMLTQTLRALERDGLVTRIVYPVIPPKVIYSLTELGLGLSEAFCGVWIWAQANHEKINNARAAYDASNMG
ncbi:helix-turn-helix domain-containing protein [Pantoea sp. GM01]|uniref:winged helix-turn-helix transcriptional regulator n=1 Tax=Pantoea sp. GM01 TaxID=1144320 RepID=UPI0002E00308|nr:helix-turn-helix domain-containing protein [Pantoea sp. GM01]